MNINREYSDTYKGSLLYSLLHMFISVEAVGHALFSRKLARSN